MFFDENSPFKMSNTKMAAQRFNQLVNTFQTAEPQDNELDTRMIDYMERQVSPYIENTVEYNAKQILIYGDPNYKPDNTNNTAESLNSALRRKTKFKALLLHHLGEVIVERQDKDIREITSAIREGPSTYKLSKVWLDSRRVKNRNKKTNEIWPIPDSEWKTEDTMELKKLKKKVLLVHTKPTMSRIEVVRLLSTMASKNSEKRSIINQNNSKFTNFDDVYR